MIKHIMAILIAAFSRGYKGKTVQFERSSPYHRTTGHQSVSVTLSCNGISLNYAIVLYDKSRSKIQILLDIAEKLPETPVLSYFLCDSWHTSVKVMNAFLN